ncbi:hypothetical protein ACFV2S_05595 [Streptomyces sp. NPDC059695]|uniref:hypothetical protein n=1 Tax=Streptomyces sp. NPDC059695 TaxID=3346910 RepID=UPI0036966EA9
MGMSDRGDEAVQYVRFESLHRNARGHFTGVFGLVNNLAREGRLSDDQESFRRRNNSWYNGAYTDPSTVDPHVYDDGINPGAAAWFESATQGEVTASNGVTAEEAAVLCAGSRCIELAGPGQAVPAVCPGTCVMQAGRLPSGAHGGGQAVRGRIRKR